MGISARINFEALVGQRASSHLDLHNEGSTAIYYTWQQLPLPRSFADLRSQTTSPHFYFNSSAGTYSQAHTHKPTYTCSKHSYIKIVCYFNLCPTFLSFSQLSICLSTIHSVGVILPGDTQQVDFIFKSEVPGIKSELWQLNTHPVLLRGASMQVTLRGVALYHDKTADQQLDIEVLNC